ncbi:hypothetical protein BGX26_011543 [Mortierella sp. AD094]|nr:hypothetical protein BGX26_011543 [Mortierella sp. AD094]
MASPLTQKFRSPINGEIVEIDVYGDDCDQFVLWRHIVQSLGDVRVLRANGRDIYCMMDQHYCEKIPPRVKYFPDAILEVILNVKTPVTVKDKKDEKELSLVKLSPLPERSRDPEDNGIRFGSKICLRHMHTGGHLRTPDMCYNRQSGPSQHVVYNFHSLEPRQDDWWEVFVTQEEKEVKGLSEQNIQYGSRVRFFNVAKSRWLHSHKEYKSPVTPGQQEVTGFGDVDNSDFNDVWIVERAEAGSDFWRTSDVFILRHEATNRYLYSHSTDFFGEKEVVAFSKRNDINTLWRAQFQ